MNVHRGETWQEVLAALKEKTLLIRDRVSSPQKAFGLGLRLSHEAAKSLEQKAQREILQRFLKKHNLYVFTINGFPYGFFHGRPVKQEVYRPDWRSPARRDYTIMLAYILAGLLPEDMEGSISTVPCSYKSWIHTEEEVLLMVRMIMDCVAKLSEIKERSGKTIHIGLEPEPDCFLENTSDIIKFFKGPVNSYGRKYLADSRECGLTEAGEMIKRHLGACLDTCHIAVQFEDPLQSLTTLVEHQIRISKVQISAALEVHPSQKVNKELASLADPIYLHQIKEKGQNKSIKSYPDLKDALENQIKEGVKQRIHYHVPVYWEGRKDFRSTSFTLKADFWKALCNGAAAHVEIETYTFDAWPAEIKKFDLIDIISEEYKWTIKHLNR